MISSILELKEYGMIDDWIAKHRPRLPQSCQKSDSKTFKSKKKGRKVGLSLKNLSGAFLVLGLGVFLSFCTFIFELLIERFRYNL